ncbi:MAG: hypothetical protein U9R38_00170 [Candidatus Margulisiibacteriota bacterium]|nr:hypothetical protein [Candidatus Margulisiibacteriota bacterium]
MNKIIIGFLSATLFFSAILFSNPVIAAPDEVDTSLIEEFNNGEIDWGLAMVTVKGIGRYADWGTKYYKRQMAKRAATLDAYRNLAVIINGVRVDSETIVENYATKSDKIKTEVSAFIRDARVIDVEYNDEQEIAEVTMLMPLLGESGLADIIFPEILPEIEPRQMATKMPNYTGLIVDARGLGIVPAMSPKIIDSKGKELYGTFEIIDPDYVIEYGIISYDKTLKKAKNNPRIGDNPIIIEGLKAASDKKLECDVIVDVEDANKVRKANKKDKFLENCQVVLII